MREVNGQERKDRNGKRISSLEPEEQSQSKKNEGKNMNDQEGQGTDAAKAKALSMRVGRHTHFLLHRCRPQLNSKHSTLRKN